MEFKLTPTCKVAFQCIKEEISKNVTLPYFNPNTSTIVFLQNSKPVMFASRALTGSERDYQNLERECLATIWGMENGKVPQFSLWKGIHLRNRSKATSIYIQEAHGGNFPKDLEISS